MKTNVTFIGVRKGPAASMPSVPRSTVDGYGRRYADPYPYLSVQVDRKDYQVNGVKVQVLDDLHFEVARGEFVSLLGPSGSGKTTLLRTIVGLDRDYIGQIALDGTPLEGPGPDRGIVFQESRLLPWLTVGRNVAFALPNEIGLREKVERIGHALRLVGLADFENAWPYQLSGGMEKRVALARALVNVPSLLLLDEPFGALDTFARYALQDEMARVHAEEGVTTVLVTHDVDEAVYLSDRVLVLTASPATIQTSFAISLPRPRLRASEAFARLRTEILGKLLK
jgi:ABC-type nitrate/sulfonate/bicarbonate transport system ATPase subunit